jgi:hypothetical protein
MRLSILCGCAVLAAVTGIVLAQTGSDADGGSSVGRASHVPEADCSGLVRQEIPPAGEADLAVGPVILRSARYPGTRPRAEFKAREGRNAAAKIPVILEPGARLVLSIDRRDRRRAVLSYREKTRAAKRVSDGDPFIRFEACWDDMRTGWPGAFIVSGPGCVRVRLDIKGRSKPATRRIAFGRGACD